MKTLHDLLIEIAKQWKDIKVGDKLKDGSIVTQIHRVHKEPCCKVIYDNDREMICAYRHVFLIDISNLLNIPKHNYT